MLTVNGLLENHIDLFLQLWQIHFDHKVIHKGTNNLGFIVKRTYACHFLAARDKREIRLKQDTCVEWIRLDQQSVLALFPRCQVEIDRSHRNTILYPFLGERHEARSIRFHCSIYFVLVRLQILLQTLQIRVTEPEYDL